MSIESEKTLLCQMILDSSIVPNVYDTIKPAGFSNGNYRSIYEKIYDLYSKGLKPDVMLLSHEMPEIQPYILTEIAGATGTSANWSYYADEVRNDFILSGLNASLVKAKEKTDVARKVNGDGQTIIDDLMAEVTDLTSNTNSCEVHNMADLIMQENNVIQAYIQNKREYLGIETGFRQIDDLINGLQSVYMVIGARPSMGKTALAQKMAMNMSKTVKVLFIELEMSSQQLVERAISNLSKISYRTIQSGVLTQGTLGKIVTSMSTLSENKNFIPAECRTRKLSDIINLCRAEVRNNGVQAIFIDHLGLIKVDGRLQSWEKAREISNNLQLLQRELNVPIVALSQLDRESETSKEPGLNNFRGSGAIEEDADICALLGRQRATDENETEIPAKLWIKKNRNGQVGTAHLIFTPAIVDFKDAPDEYIESLKRQEQAANKAKSRTKPENVTQKKEEWQGKSDGVDYDLF